MQTGERIRARREIRNRDRALQAFVSLMIMSSESRSTSDQTQLDKTLENQPSRPIWEISDGFSLSLRLKTSASRLESLNPESSSFSSFGLLPNKYTSKVT